MIQLSMTVVPAAVARLFWEIPLHDLDRLRHADYVIARVMTRGGWEAMRWLRETFSAAELADFLARKGERLAARDRAYWAVVSGADVSVGRGAGRPPWAGP
jgi:hypothetical protein